MGPFSIVKWVRFQLSRYGLNCPSGALFDCQMGTFSFENSTLSPLIDAVAQPFAAEGEDVG